MRAERRVTRARAPPRPRATTWLPAQAFIGLRVVCLLPFYSTFGDMLKVPIISDAGTRDIKVCCCDHERLQIQNTYCTHAMIRLFEQKIGTLFKMVNVLQMTLRTNQIKTKQIKSCK